MRVLAVRALSRWRWRPLPADRLRCLLLVSLGTEMSFAHGLDTGPAAGWTLTQSMRRVLDQLVRGDTFWKAAKVAVITVRVSRLLRKNPFLLLCVGPGMSQMLLNRT